MKKKRKSAVKHIERAKKDDGVMYVRVNNPLSLRKEILSSAIEATRGLRDYEKHIAIRALVLEKKRELYEIDHEIRSLILQLANRDLPMFKKIEEELKKLHLLTEKPKAEVRKEMVVRVRPEKVHVSEEDRLNKELEEIERRLSNLRI